MPPLRLLPVALSIASLLALPGGAGAQIASPASGPASSVDTDQQVEVTALRAPIAFPYERAFELASAVREASHGMAEVAARLTDPAPTAATLHVWLQYGETVQPLAIGPDGSFAVPIVVDALNQHAALIANRPGRTWHATVFLRPLVGRLDILTEADLDRIVEAGQAARAAMFPWYARAVMPAIRGLRVCSQHSDAVFVLRNAAGAETPLAARDAEDVYQRAARCVDLTPGRNPNERASSLRLPADVTLAYLHAR